MNYAFDSRLGGQLYQLLPEVYRNRDKRDGSTQGDTEGQHLARYLDVHGHLLDLIHATLEQQLKDTLPQSSQEWLLPYFAQLLAVNIVSPDAAGKHAEVANAVGWRQRKGTLKVAEQIAEDVGQLEAEIQEGWQRLAMTPRVDMPVMPVRVWDDTLQLDLSVPGDAARHPSLAATTVDFRYPSRAVEALSTNPAARDSQLGGIQQTWRQQNRHGVPCFPDSFEDVSKRTVDIRSSGRYHHKRLLVHVPPPDGLIPLPPIEITWADRNQQLIKETHEDGVSVFRNNTSRVLKIINDVLLDSDIYRFEGIDFAGELKVAGDGSLDLLQVEAERVDATTLNASDCLFAELSCAGQVELDSCTVLEKAFVSTINARDCILMDIEGSEVTGVAEYSRIPATASFSTDDMTVEDCTTDNPEFFGNQTALNARAVLTPNTPASIFSGASDATEIGYFHRGRIGRPVLIGGDFNGVDALHLSNEVAYPLVDVIFDGQVEVVSGTLLLKRSAMANLAVLTGLLTDDVGDEVPALDACDCLFDQLTVADGLTRLEYCTVMQAAHCRHLEASDCLFVGIISDGAGAEPESGCIRFSRIPDGFVGTTLNLHGGTYATNTREAPVFARYDYCAAGSHEYRIAVFGEAGYGVLDSATVDPIRFGAEDGGEMGVGHHKFYSLKTEAVLDKMREFLPVGMDPVLIYDRRLLQTPPQITEFE